LTSENGEKKIELEEATQLPQKTEKMLIRKMKTIPD
jgi:hypothetical protein